MKKPIYLLLAAALCFGACSKDDAPLPDPAGTATINMMDEDNGATTLGDSPVYLDAAQNFCGSGCLLFDVGEVPGLGYVGDTADYAAGMARLAAIPGHGYLVLDADDICRFPSGTYARRLGGTGYGVYVEKWLTREEQIVGAAVKLYSDRAEAEHLPAWDSRYVRELSSLVAEIELPQGDFEAYSLAEDVIECQFEPDEETGGQKLYISCYRNGLTDNYAVLLREGKVFTRLICEP